jgi:putative ABC transport system substrate-binding protein
MDRTRRKLIGGGTLALCWPATVLAQDPKRIARVVIAQKISEKSRELFRAEFAKHDWVEGRNLAMSSVDIVNAPKAEAEARAREVVAGRPDAILMLPGAEMALFKRLTNDIPVVFYNLAIDPSKIGLVESLRRPGGNFTGTSHNYELLNTKAWAMLKEIHPAMKRGGSLGEKNSDNDFYKAFPKAESIDQESMKSAARFLGIEIREIIVPKDATFAMVVEAIRKPKPDALVIDWNLTKIPGLMAFLEKAGILTCGTLEVVRNGGLLALTFDFSEGAKQAVAIVARILRGESPATIPVYQGTRYGLALNLRTARAMRLTIPASIRIQATEVIE